MNKMKFSLKTFTCIDGINWRQYPYAYPIIYIFPIFNIYKQKYILLIPDLKSSNSFFSKSIYSKGVSDAYWLMRRIQPSFSKNVPGFFRFLRKIARTQTKQITDKSSGHNGRTVFSCVLLKRHPLPSCYFHVEGGFSHQNSIIIVGY